MYAHEATGTTREASVACVLMPAAKWQGHDPDAVVLGRGMVGSQGRHLDGPAGHLGNKLSPSSLG